MQRLPFQRLTSESTELITCTWGSTTQMQPTGVYAGRRHKVLPAWPAHPSKPPPSQHRPRHHQELGGWPGSSCGSSCGSSRTTVPSAILTHASLGQGEMTSTMTMQLQCPHGGGRPGRSRDTKTPNPSQETVPAIPGRGQKTTETKALVPYIIFPSLFCVSPFR